MRLRQLFEEPEKHVAFCFGRMNPPTIGHVEVFKTLASIGGDYFIFVSQSQDKKENPLGYSDKINFIKAIHPQYADAVIENTELNTVVKVASYLYGQGYRHATFVAGSDRLEQFKKLLKDYNGIEGKAHGFYDFEVLDFKSSGQRDPDSPGVSGISASKAREAAANNDFAKFQEATGAGEVAKPMFDAVRKGLGIKESKVSTNKILKEFAPAGGSGGNNYGGDIYDILMGYIGQHHSDLFDEFGEDLIDIVVSNMAAMGAFENIDPENEDDLEDAVADIFTQLEQEQDESIEEVDRRGFLKGLGAAALAGAGMASGSAKAQQPLPVIATIKITLPDGTTKVIKKDLGNSYDYRLDDAKKDLENLLDRKGIRNYTIHLDRYEGSPKDNSKPVNVDYMDKGPATMKRPSSDYLDKSPYTPNPTKTDFMAKAKNKEFRDMDNY